MVSCKVSHFNRSASGGHMILRDSYIDGAEYTMGGKMMRIEKIICPGISEKVDRLKKTGKKIESQKMRK
jgi:hypothetical protein